MLYRTLVALVIATALPISNAADRDYRFSDSHMHYVNFFQETDGMTALLEGMDAANVDHVMISGIPLTKKWDENEPKRPRYYAGDYGSTYWYSATDTIVANAVMRLTPEQRKRVHPFMCGFNPTDKNADAHIRRMLEMYPGLWQGIGEVFTRHDHITAMTEGETPRPNHKAMDRVYRVAAEYDLPVMVHANITSQRERNPLYIEEVEYALKKHPNVRFIWAHAGTSKTLHRVQERLNFLHPRLKTLLKDYPNLYIDLSWSMLEPYLLNTDGSPDKDWVALVEAFPDRFMIGSDVVGSFDSMNKFLSGFEPFLNVLPESVAKAIARDNFLAILPSNRQIAAVEPD